jgi:hypothetical protein
LALVGRWRGGSVQRTAPSASAAAHCPPPCCCFQYCSECHLRYHRHSCRLAVAGAPSCARSSGHQRTMMTCGSPASWYFPTSSHVTVSRGMACCCCWSSTRKRTLGSSAPVQASAPPVLPWFRPPPPLYTRPNLASSSSWATSPEAPNMEGRRDDHAERGKK